MGGEETVAIPWVIVLGSLRLATNREVFRRPLSMDEACAVVDGWFAQDAVLALNPDEEHWAFSNGWRWKPEAQGTSPPMRILRPSRPNTAPSLLHRHGRRAIDARALDRLAPAGGSVRVRLRRRSACRDHRQNGRGRNRPRRLAAMRTLRISAHLSAVERQRCWTTCMPLVFSP